jgi:class 3 adenylate cyclase
VSEAATTGVASEDDVASASQESSVTGAATPPEAERRQLTVMFVDMVGSTRLSAELDPEDMRQLLLDYQSAVGDAVSKYDGHIARYFGDGVLCYFGWPRAHERSAEEAVRAASAVTKAVAALQTAAKEPLAARVGIATGLVVIGDIIGEGAAEEEAVIGETPNLAARLQGLAEPKQVIVSETTRRLVDRAFATASLGDVALKGFVDEVGAFVVTGEKSGDARFETRSSGRVSELVGREHELAMIEDRWKRALGGEGQAVLLVGEAGIGKSRIVQAFVDGLNDVKHYRIRQRWTPFHTDTPFYGSIQHMLGIANFRPEDTDEDKLDKLEALLLDEKHVPIYAELLGVDASKRHGPLGLTSEQLRHATLHAIADETVQIARRRPVCIILEDAHWMDASSLELARVTFERLRTERILALLPARPEIDPSFANHPALTRISLNRMGNQEVRRIIHSIAGGKSLPPALVDDITAKTDGVPLFVEEVTKSVLESEHVTETEDTFELTVPVDSLEVPATLQDSLMARLDRQPSAKEVAQVAACIGREFDAEALQAITGFGESTLNGALDQLREVDVILRRAGAANRYRFRHALLCDAAYQSLLKSKRKDIHGRIVEHLESRLCSEPEIIAQHAWQAGLVAKAVSSLRDAAMRDFLQNAYSEAAAHAERAVRWIRELPESADRLLAEAKLQQLAAYSLIPNEGYSSPRTERAFDYAADIALRSGHTSTAVTSLTGKALVKMTRGDRPGLVMSTDELVRVSDEDGRDYIRFWGLLMKGISLLLGGNIANGRRLLGETKSLYVDEHERRALRAGYPMWESLAWWEQMAAWLAGDAARDEEISTCLERAVLGEYDLARPAFARGWCPVFYTFCALARNDYDTAWQLATRALGLATEHNIPSYGAWSRCVLSIHEMARGDVEEALEQFAEASAQTAALSFHWGLPTFRTEFAKASLARGMIEAAREVSRQARQAVSQTGELWWEPEALRVEGDVRLAEGDRAGAEARYRKAIEVAQAHGSVAWERRTAASLTALGSS